MLYTHEQKLVIDGELIDLNTYINACRTNHFKGGILKKDADWIVEVTAKQQKLKPIKSPCFVEFSWYCKNKKKDKDNVCFAKKFIFDGLQNAGILEQDSWGSIDGFTDLFFISKDNPRIEVVLRY